MTAQMPIRSRLEYVTCNDLILIYSLMQKHRCKDLDELLDQAEADRRKCIGPLADIDEKIR
ncbi:MAG: hypothetical protein MZV63_02440 [Marinilabiliales bacterium]|nr:hypothetical protein [Marinilabiliales bacterium]